MKTTYTAILDDAQRELILEVPADPGQAQVLARLGEESLLLDVAHLGAGELHLLVEDRSVDVLVDGEGEELLVHLNGVPTPVRLLDEQQAARRSLAGRGPRVGSDGLMAVRAPMPGKVVKCLVQPGDEVAQDQGVIIVEAMKMENELRAPAAGRVKAVHVEEGRNVDAGEELVLIE